MPDLARWSDPANYSPRWSGRAEIIGRYLQDCASVADLGAGTQILKPYVVGRYYPVDFVGLSPDTTIIDFDGDWHAGMMPAADGIAMAGLLEHLRDPVGVIRRLAPVGRVWAVSYMDPARHSERGLISLATLRHAFTDAGMRITDRATWRGQHVFRLVRA